MKNKELIEALEFLRDEHQEKVCSPSREVTDNIRRLLWYTKKINKQISKEHNGNYYLGRLDQLIIDQHEIHRELNNLLHYSAKSLKERNTESGENQ